MAIVGKPAIDNYMALIGNFYIVKHAVNSRRGYAECGERY